ncbi:hypothetical protein NJC40_20765 [Pseudomonas sp. 21LCFQ02]|uniref:hypothetical protein n=1 Tax=Pseudomonas sp. 21LCFQ02 TaxID=2957505 RepID=UPI00209B9CD3|nr:hypothetical protein [Pseudomonas sp. 21LCFQ02]MCO8170199.1 hypothetical protein [Pseudomonas sp. 21LCFQ02]
MTDAVNDAAVEPVVNEANADALPAKTLKVIVIDDELSGLTSFHLNEVVGDFRATLGDVTSPQFEEFWRLTEELGGLPDIEKYDEDEKQAYLQSDNFVQSVVLNAQFEAKVELEYKKWLNPFLERSKEVSQLKSALEGAFSAPEFELVFEKSRPTKHTDLLAYDLVIFDLVLQKSAGAVDQLVDYLKALSDSQPEQLPSIIVMSSRKELISERMRFSTQSKISAAGLVLLPKNEVFRENFGAAGIRLNYQQLQRQKEAAQHMRKFMSVWTAALGHAQESAETTLWNLDAAAMQEIHLSASLDSDPYDGHLSEYLAKEYLWHVERSASVSEAIGQLDSCFKQQLVRDAKKTPSIATRLLASVVNPGVARELVSHFNWLGFPLEQNFLAKGDEEILDNFSRLLPFGAVLASAEDGRKNEYLVHITQQCDILSVVRSASDGFTAKFAVARAIEVTEGDIPDHDNQDIVAKGLKADGKEFDLKLAKGSILALPAGMLITYLRTHAYDIVGRLRHEIANQFLVGTANHMTRPAAIKATRSQVLRVKLYLFGKSLDGGPLVPFVQNGANQVAIGLSKKGNSFYFSDDSSMSVALWIKGLVDPSYQKSLDALNLVNALSVGVGNNTCIEGIVNMRVEEKTLTAEERDGIYNANHSKIRNNVWLLAICEEAA